MNLPSHLEVLVLPFCFIVISYVYMTVSVSFALERALVKAFERNSGCGVANLLYCLHLQPLITYPSTQ